MLAKTSNYILPDGVLFARRLFFCFRENNSGYCADPILYSDAVLLYNNGTRRERPMTTRERILAIKLLEKQEKNPEYARRIGVRVDMVKKDPNAMED